MVTGDQHESMDSVTLNSDHNKRKFALGHEKNAGAPCLKCGPEKCEGGLDLHFWRKICKTCKCKPEEHDVNKTEEEESLHHVVRTLFSKDSPVGHIRDYFHKLEAANNAPRSEYAKQFAWCPLGLEERLLMKYMDALPPQMKPKVGSDGAKYRRKQMMYQLPVHDHDESYCANLTEREKESMRQFCEDRNQNALGVGDVREKSNPVSKWICYRCKGDISLGDVAVFASCAGENRYWHPGCFVCNVCNNLLVDLIYFYKEGGIYCGRHYAELYKPRCSACDELIYAEERVLEAMDKKWHHNHLCCDHCDRPLSTQSFVTAEGKPWCNKCHDEDLANRREKCRQLDGEFSNNNDKPICHPSAERTVLGVCDTCGVEFTPGETKIVYQSKSFHHNCFTCDTCKKPLGTAQFVKRDGRQFCEDCDDASNAKICDHCNERIKSSWVQNDGKILHAQCFVCALCYQSLAGKTFKKHDGNNFCQDCYRVHFAKKCKVCQQPIEESLMFVAYDKAFFHRDCFTCSKCGLSLELEKFYLIGNDKMCVSCGS